MHRYKTQTNGKTELFTTCDDKMLPKNINVEYRNLKYVRFTVQSIGQWQPPPYLWT